MQIGEKRKWKASGIEFVVCEFHMCWPPEYVIKYSDFLKDSLIGQRRIWKYSNTKFIVTEDKLKFYGDKVIREYSVLFGEQNEF